MKIEPLCIFLRDRAGARLENVAPFVRRVAAQETNGYRAWIIFVVGSIGVVERRTFVSQDNDGRYIIRAVLKMSGTRRSDQYHEAQQQCENTRLHAPEAIAGAGVMSIKKWLPKQVSGQIMERL